MKSDGKLALAALLFSAVTAHKLSGEWTDLQVEGKPIQIHGFASQGFLLSDGNNYLTADTNKGTFSFTDFGANISVQLTPNFRVGAQVYDRNIGHLGDWHPNLDWAGGDYKFKDWLGIRAGKVKTILGLHNDTQDFEFLHTWAILPQSVYPLDLRGSSLAHVGGDIYGNISLAKFGSLSYTAAAGLVPNDRYGGYIYGLELYGIQLRTYDGRMESGDLRWNTPVTGLVAGVSYFIQAIHGDGAVQLNPRDPLVSSGLVPNGTLIPNQEKSRKNETSQFFVGYERDRLKVEAECRGVSRDERIILPVGVPNATANSRGFYAAASYRLAKKLELGTYYSRFYADWRQNLDSPSNRIFDKVISARVDLTSHLDLKVEGHFINGDASAADTLRGFYLQDNPQGLKPQTKLLVIRMGVEF